MPLCASTTTDHSHSSDESARQEAVGILALSTLKGVGFQTLWQLAESGYSYSHILALNDTEEVADLLKLHGARLDKMVLNDWASVRQRLIERGLSQFDRLASQNISILTQAHLKYPSALLELNDAPHWLFVQGNVDVLNMPSITVVGTRAPSKHGLWLTEFVGYCLHEWQCPTVSGLATGIDQGIHLASIEAKVPTIAVLGTGIDSDYPKNAQSMRHEILEGGGALVTEYLLQEKYSKQNFVRRNRLQAALGRILIPVEWKEKSGTAHTVRFATKLKRPVAALAVPSRSPHEVNLTANLGGKNSRLFKIPGEEPAFRTFVTTALRAAAYVRHTQTSLFD